MANPARQVLVVEDEPVTRHLLVSLLEKWGYNVIALQNGDEASTYIHTRPIPPLVLLDWNMPGKSGIEITEELKKMNLRTPLHIILITGRTKISDVILAMQAGVNDYITKPIDHEQLRFRLLVGIQSLEAQKLELTKKANEDRNAALLSLGMLAGCVADEINSPLANALEFNDEFEMMLKERSLDMHKIFENSTKIRSHLIRIVDVVKGLLKFSRDSSVDPFSRSDVFALTTQCLEDCKSRAEKAGINLTFETPSKPVWADLQFSSISQALLHILENSLDAVEHLSNKWVRVSFADYDDRIDIVVTDSGPGLPKELKDKIFEPFFSTRGQKRGLGLCMASGIAASHGGVLFLNMDSPQTQFVLSLPKKQKKMAA